MSLSAPLAVSVEVRAGDRRVFRLSRDVGESRLTLERKAPFEVGRRVMVTFTLPGAEMDAPSVAVTLRAEIALTEEDGHDDDDDGDEGGRALSFTDLPREPRQAIVLYLTRRLGLPPPPGASRG